MWRHQRSDCTSEFAIPVNSVEYQFISKWNKSDSSVRLKSKRQRINTINFYLHDISTPLVGVVFKHRLNVRTVNMQMLIWRHICFAMASLITQCTFKMLMFLNKDVHVFFWQSCYHRGFILYLKQNSKFSIICTRSKRLENLTNWNPSILRCCKPISINSAR